MRIVTGAVTKDLTPNGALRASINLGASVVAGHADGADRRRQDPGPQLTSRQWELLRLVAAGHTNGQIARRLSISETTGRKHLEHVFERLRVTTRTATVTRAF